MWAVFSNSFMFGIFLWFFQPLFCKLLEKKMLKSTLSLMALLVWLMEDHMMVDGLKKNMNNAANMESLLDVDQYVTFCEKEGL